MSEQRKAQFLTYGSLIALVATLVALHHRSTITLITLSPLYLGGTMLFEGLYVTSLCYRLDHGLTASRTLYSRAVVLLPALGVFIWLFAIDGSHRQWYATTSTVITIYVLANVMAGFSHRPRTSANT